MEIKHYPFPPPGDAPAVEREPYPAPLLTSEMPAPGIEASGPARILAAVAARHGWTSHITFANGYLPHAAYGTPSAKPKKSEAVRLSRGAQRAVAVRMDGSWVSLWTWGRDTFFTRSDGLEAFTTIITGAVQGCAKPPVSTLAPLHGCAVTGMRFVRAPIWGAVQGPEVAS
jgi:hypothetical protein